MLSPATSTAIEHDKSVPHSELAEKNLDAIFAALADPTRRALLRQLRLAPSTVGALARPHSMSLPAVSKHIKVLERAGLIARCVDGRVHRCALRGEALSAVDSWLDGYRAYWEGTLDSLADFIAGDESSQLARESARATATRARGSKRSAAAPAGAGTRRRGSKR